MKITLKGINSLNATTSITGSIILLFISRLNLIPGLLVLLLSVALLVMGARLVKGAIQIRLAALINAAQSFILISWLKDGFMSDIPYLLLVFLVVFSVIALLFYLLVIAQQMQKKQ